MERGEIEGNGASALTTLKGALNADWIKDKKIKIIAQWAPRPNPELPNVPSILDLAKNDTDKAALPLVLARLDFGRPFFLPPNVPADRVEALRKAFNDKMKDPDFLPKLKSSSSISIRSMENKCPDSLPMSWQRPRTSLSACAISSRSQIEYERACVDDCGALRSYNIAPRARECRLSKVKLRDPVNFLKLGGFEPCLMVAASLPRLREALRGSNVRRRRSPEALARKLSQTKHPALADSPSRYSLPVLRMPRHFCRP